MKLVLYDAHRPGVLTDGGVVDISVAVGLGRNGQETMTNLIRDFESIRPAIEREVREGRPTPLASVRLRAPLPRPGKLLAMSGNYREHSNREVRPIEVFFKSPESILDPDGTVMLPKVEFSICHHEAELGLVIGPHNAKDVPASKAFDYIFGYTAAVDVSAREFGRAGSYTHKAFDTFTPLGPCIVTKDEVPEPQNLNVQLKVDGQIRHTYNTDDMEHPITEIIEYVSTVMTLNPGDLIICGTNHEGLGPLQDGETGEMGIVGFGFFKFKVSDPLKRRWYKMTDAEAVKQGFTARKQLA